MELSKTELDVDDGSTKARAGRLPPIRILDLLLLTASIAFIFMLQDRLRRNGSFPETVPAFDFVYQLVFAFQSGAALAGVYWLFVQKRLTGRFFHTPGHWFLGAFSLSTCGSLVVFGCLPILDDGWLTDSSSQWPMGLAAAIEIGVAMFLFWAAIELRGVWRAVSSLLALTFVWTSISTFVLCFAFGKSGLITPMAGIRWHDILQVVSWVSCGILMVVWAIAVVSDLKKKNDRDWLHWLGVTLVMIQTVVLPLMNWILVLLINSNVPGAAEFS